MTAITRIHALNLTFGALLACASTASAIAQQDVANQPFKARGQVHAAPSHRPLQSTTHAPANPDIVPMHKERQPVPKHVPGQAKPHGPLVMQTHGPSYGVSPIAHKPPRVYTAQPRTPHAPTGPGPMHAGTGATSSANEHGIIFVGGHAQGVAPGSKQALNPQPIPPGHQIVAPLHPIAPRPASVVKPKTHGLEPH